jgi:hypothetical protein
VARLKGHQCEQQPQALRKANQDKTDSYCLDRQYVLPQAEFTDHQNVKTPEPKSDHRDAADTDHIGKDLSHGQACRAMGRRNRLRRERERLVRAKVELEEDRKVARWKQITERLEHIKEELV